MEPEQRRAEILIKQMQAWWPWVIIAKILMYPNLWPIHLFVFYIWAPEELSARPCSGAMEHALFYRLKSKRVVNKRWIALCVCLCASVRVSRIGLSFSLSKRYTRPHLGSPEPLLSTPAHHWILITIHYEVTHLTALCLISLLRTHH